jgi:hypothetical protein
LIGAKKFDGRFEPSFCYNLNNYRYESWVMQDRCPKLGLVMVKVFIVDRSHFFLIEDCELGPTFLRTKFTMRLAAGTIAWHRVGASLRAGGGSFEFRFSNVAWVKGSVARAAAKRAIATSPAGKLSIV